MQFPIFKTKVQGLNRKFNLVDLEEQKKYFKAKAGEEIEKLKKFLSKNTFIAYFLGKKNSGKGTYSKIFSRLVGHEKVAHLSVGDMVREVDKELADSQKKKELISFLEKNYRGFKNLKEIIYVLENRSTRTLLPTELVLTLIKREIEKIGRKSLFIDGFPRGLDQIDFSLFFRDLVGYRNDPDIFVLIDIPETVIDERIKYRRVCPVCKTARNLRLLITPDIGYDKEKNEFYLICDNPDCKNIKMVSKEGDEFGITPIKARLEKDEELIQRALSLYGIPKILIRNSVPVSAAKEYIDDYEITPEYVLEWDENSKKVQIKEKPWVVKDDEGVESYSLLAQPATVSFIKQLVEVFNL
jgi:adenylate kinase family enzyme